MNHSIESLIMCVTILVTAPVLVSVILGTFKQMAVLRIQGLNKIFGTK